MPLSEEAALLLQKITNAVEKLNYLDSAAGEVLKQVSKYTGWEYGEIWLPDEEGKQLKNFLIFNSNKLLFEEFERFSAICKFAKNIGLAGKVWAKEGAEWDSKLSIDSDFLRYDVARRASVVSGMGFFTRVNNSPCVIIFFQVKETTDNEKYFGILSEIREEVGKILGAKQFPVNK